MNALHGDYLMLFHLSTDPHSPQGLEREWQDGVCMISMEMPQVVVQNRAWQSQVQTVPLGEFGLLLVIREGSQDWSNHASREIRRIFFQ